MFEKCQPFIALQALVVLFARVSFHVFAQVARSGGAVLALSHAQHQENTQLDCIRTASCSDEHD